jgi:pimeloyl-ACP methyl ester carboxylesterase
MAKEKVILFGNKARLVGISTEPNSKTHAETLPGVLFWNAGLLPKVGPFRLFVDVARRLSELGFLSFRFDVSGKGDSKAEKEGQLERERTLVDIRCAMDFLSEERGIANFVLVGSCSGADEAFPLAVADKRVGGLVLLDAFGYRTWKYYLRNYGPRLLQPGVWQSYFHRQGRRALKLVKGEASHNPQGGIIFLREFPAKRKIEDELEQLIAREVSMLFIYSGGVKEYYNYKNQFRDTFRSLQFNGRLQVEYLKDASHTYPEFNSRNQLINILCDWMKGHFKGIQEVERPVKGKG